jgi:hypothetical protein
MGIGKKPHSLESVHIAKDIPKNNAKQLNNDAL